MTAIKRRQFLSLLVSLPLLPGQVSADGSAPAAARLASAVSADDGSHSLLIRTVTGQTLMQHTLPARAHQVLADAARGHLVVVSRRPGQTLEVIDYRRLKPVARIQAEAGASFYGHAEMSADGRFLMTTEARAGDDAGQIVLRDLDDNYRVVRRFGSGGVGPHELKRYGNTLVIANGGIRTEGREKTNLDTMQPSLVRLNPDSGAVLEQHRFDAAFHQASIRHIDVSADGTVLAAMQFEGTPRPDTPLAGLQRAGGPLIALPIPADVHASLQQYCGTACIDASGQFGAISAPRGNSVLFWSLADERFLGRVSVRDGCGLARTPESGVFFASSGAGRVYRLDARTLSRTRIDETPSLHWDNHMVNLG